MIKQKLSGFIVEIVMFSRSCSNDSKRLNELDHELPRLGTVILALPLNSQSRNLFDAERFEVMKDGALFVNVARGPIIDTDALIAELNSGRIQAALDLTDLDLYPVAIHSDHSGGCKGCVDFTPNSWLHNRI